MYTYTQDYCKDTTQLKSLEQLLKVLIFLQTPYSQLLGYAPRLPSPEIYCSAAPHPTRPSLCNMYTYTLLHTIASQQLLYCITCVCTLLQQCFSHNISFHYGNVGTVIIGTKIKQCCLYGVSYMYLYVLLGYIIVFLLYRMTITIDHYNAIYTSFNKRKQLHH